MGISLDKNFILVMGMSFLADIFFLRGYEFGQVIPSEFLPIVISLFTLILILFLWVLFVRKTVAMYGHCACIDVCVMI
jgi:hypothetical protein